MRKVSRLILIDARTYPTLNSAIASWPSAEGFGGFDARSADPDPVRDLAQSGDMFLIWFQPPHIHSLLRLEICITCCSALGLPSSTIPGIRCLLPKKIGSSEGINIRRRSAESQLPAARDAFALFSPFSSVLFSRRWPAFPAMASYWSCNTEIEYSGIMEGRTPTGRLVCSHRAGLTRLSTVRSVRGRIVAPKAVRGMTSDARLRLRAAERMLSSDARPDWVSDLLTAPFRSGPEPDPLGWATPRDAYLVCLPTYTCYEYTANGYS